MARGNKRVKLCIQKFQKFKNDIKNLNVKHNLNTFDCTKIELKKKIGKHKLMFFYI